ncbi:methionine--tRNA ligase, mitochondrial-like [Saccostrea echinata]|uniref:methionine--tRNA ligase, mitochondrial-like n=1 Tax=Saccostrea echinata TaxID=191078 RepID=UPI002A82EA4E|nr:methionine--tRNA ligase, mitochondrial-like [Saccostrea echinata]
MRLNRIGVEWLQIFSNRYRLFPFTKSYCTHLQPVGKEKVYITTPIFYVNAAPHIGHLYTALLADAVARFHTLHGKEVIFSTGTDEHGLKIQTSAAKHNKSPELYCDEISAKFKTLFDRSGVSYSYFIRTTDETHTKAVENLWTTLVKKGYIYKGKYEGWYSISDEEFLSEDEVCDQKKESGEIQKVSVSSGQPVVWMSEENYMFRLTSFKAQLIKWLNTGVVYPEEKRSQVDLALRNLQDLSVSRSSSRLSWGIPVPGDSSQTIYVWLDALMNYLTVAGYPGHLQNWPPDIQIVGQDILKFHAIYWPAFLLGADLDLPKQIVCHAHWTVDGYKMSKSRGNVVDPEERMNRLTETGFRYFLLRSGTVFTNCNYNDDVAKDIINAEIVNTYLNLLSRTSSKSINKQAIFPAFDGEAFQSFFTEEERDMFNSLSDLIEICNNHYKGFLCHKVSEAIFEYLRWSNKLFNDHEPWQLCKDPINESHVRCLLHLNMETLRVCSILLQPLIPDIANQVLDRLGIREGHRLIKHCEERRQSHRDRDHLLIVQKNYIMQRIK